MPTYPTDYEVPKKSGNYLKLNKAAEYRIRVLSNALIGWEDWDASTPLRFPNDQKPDAPIDPEKEVKHFHAFIVWNYKESKIQILLITQKTIQDAFKGLTEDKAHGDLHLYDIRIFRQDKPKVSYMVLAEDPSPVSNEIKRSFFEKPCNLDALFAGADPWATSHADGFTAAAFSTTDEPVAPAAPVKATGTKKATPVEELKTVVAQANLDTSLVPEFVELCAKKKVKTTSSIIDSALRVPADFKRAYGDFLVKRHGQPVTA